MLIGLVVFFSSGLLLIALAIPLIRRRIKPNYFYGLRVPATFADEWVWYEANARSGRDLLVLGAAISLLSLLLWLPPEMPEAVYVLTLACFSGGGALAMAVVGWRRANRLLRESPNRRHS